jgi:hypothetical protein
MKKILWQLLFRECGRLLFAQRGKGTFLPASQKSKQLSYLGVSSAPRPRSPQRGEIIAVGPGGRDEADKLTPIGVERAQLEAALKWRTRYPPYAYTGASSRALDFPWAFFHARVIPQFASDLGRESMQELFHKAGSSPALVERGATRRGHGVFITRLAAERAGFPITRNERRRFRPHRQHRLRGSQRDWLDRVETRYCGH